VGKSGPSAKKTDSRGAGNEIDRQKKLTRGDLKKIRKKGKGWPDAQEKEKGKIATY